MATAISGIYMAFGDWAGREKAVYTI